MARKTGVQGHAESRTRGLFSATLWRIAVKQPSDERVPAKADAKKVRAAAVSAAHKKNDLTDSQIAEARHAHEVGGKTCKELAALYAVSYDRMYQILDYQVRTFGV